MCIRDSLYVQVENTSGNYKGEKEIDSYQPGLTSTVTMSGNNKSEFVVSKTLLDRVQDYVVSVYGDYYERFKEGQTADPASLVTQGLIGKYVVSTRESQPLYMMLDELSGDEAITSKLRVKLTFPHQTTLKSLDWQNEDCLLYTSRFIELQRKQQSFWYLSQNILKK